MVCDHAGPDTSDAAIAERLRSPEVFWLDLHGVEPADIVLMRDVFGFHPLAIEDVEDFGQRAKVEEYDGFTYLVAFGAAPQGDADRLVEVHIFYSDHYLLTVHRDEAPAIDETGRRCDTRPELLENAPSLLYHVLDALVDGFFPVMDDIDARIAGIETRLEGSPRRAHHQRDLRDAPRVGDHQAGDRPPARPDGAHRVRVGRSPRADRGEAALLPGRRGPPHPHLRDHRRLSRPSRRRHRRLPLADQQPAQPGDEAAHGDRRDLPAAHLRDRLLRPELQLDGPTTWAGPGGSSSWGSSCKWWWRPAS